jgi:peptidoglycan/xylan/chitin deacetylase (PgdA/CDA1 family)
VDAHRPRPRPRRLRRRRDRRLAAVAVVLAATVAWPHLGAAALRSLPDQPAPLRLIVSLTFDDGSASEYVTRPILASYGMHATFFINSGLVESGPYYMTWRQIGGLGRDGNEIGGHTSHHVDLTTLGPEDQRSEVCQDRQELRARHFAADDFAYPYAASNTAVEDLVRECGYDSARGVGRLDCSSGCPAAETMPPLDRYRTRTPPPVMQDTTLAKIQGWITGAEDGGGGWVQLVFHNICDACTPYSMTESNFTALLDWLRARRSRGTGVRTVRQALLTTRRP